MIRRLDHKKMGTSDRGWLKSRFHFSFADYRDPDRMGFGVLRVVNDDLVAVGGGFDLHPHRDMEILSYVVEGRLTHGDSMGNRRTIGRGDVQYMSAGSGCSLALNFYTQHKNIYTLTQNNYTPTTHQHPIPSPTNIPNPILIENKKAPSSFIFEKVLGVIFLPQMKRIR